jgi:hypothetical protein
MFFSAVPQDEAIETGPSHVFPSGGGGSAQQPLSSSLNGSGTTPRLLFTWDPYGHATQAGAGGPQPPKPPETDVAVNDGDDGRAPSSGAECSTPSSASNDNAAPAASPATAASGTAAQPPLTISSLLSGVGGTATSKSSGVSGGVRSPQLSSHAAVHTPHHQPSAEPASAHSTPSGPVLKRISTSAKDGRQYFLDYSPNTSANVNPSGVAGAMPNLMLPPNLSPHAPSQYPPPQLKTETDLQEADPHGGSTTTSPQAAPLVSAPRSSSIGGVVGPAPYAYNSYPTHASSSYAVYGTSPQKMQSSSLLGNSMNSGLLSASIGSIGGATTQHNPYRTSPTFHPMPVTSVITSSSAAPQPVQVVVQQVQTADTDADLYEVLEATPSLFIKRLLPPPPPLLDVARVLPTPGVVQTLCERWCSLVEAVLRSREFSDVTTQPPPPPPLPSPTNMSPTGVDAVGDEDAEGSAKNTTQKAAAAGGGTTTSSAVQEELRAWYNAAVEWYEQLDQAGAAAVDIRATSKAVAYAIEAAASGRGRRGGQAGNGSNAGSNGRYHGQGNAAAGGGGRGGAPGYRGGAYGGYQGNSPTAYGGRGGSPAAMGGYRGGGGGGAAANFYNVVGTHNVSGGNVRNVNPYAEGWTFSGDTQTQGQESLLLPPPPSGSVKASYMTKLPTLGQQGYAAHPAM